MTPKHLTSYVNASFAIFMEYLIENTIIITLPADLLNPRILAYVAYPVQIFTHLR